MKSNNTIEFVVTILSQNLNILKHLENDSHSFHELKIFVDFLKKHKKDTILDFIEKIQRTNDRRKNSLPFRSNSNKSPRDISILDLKETLMTTHLTKKQLLHIGEELFGLPQGSNQRHNSKDLIEILIRQAENRQTLDIINKIASDKNYS